MTYVFPAERRFAALAVDVGDGVQSGEQDAFLGLAARHIDTVWSVGDREKYRGY